MIAQAAEKTKQNKKKTKKYCNDELSKDSHRSPLHDSQYVSSHRILPHTHVATHTKSRLSKRHYKSVLSRKTSADQKSKLATKYIRASSFLECNRTSLSTVAAYYATVNLAHNLTIGSIADTRHVRPSRHCTRLRF
jgi:hypothetical protein